MANREESPRFKWPFPSWKADWLEWQQIFRDLINNIDATLFSMMESQFLVFKELPDVQIVETIPGTEYRLTPAGQAVFISRTNHIEMRVTDTALILQPDSFVVLSMTPGAVGPQVMDFELIQQGMDISPSMIPIGYVLDDYSIYWYNGSYLPVGTLMRLFETGGGGGGDTVRKPKVIDIVDCTAAPPTEVSGDRYILDDTAGVVHADWDGAAKLDIVQFNGVAWVAETPEEGWECWVDDKDADAVYIDDPAPAWELHAGEFWKAGAGVSSLLRTANVTGTADGNFAINVGFSGKADADYSFVGNSLNVIVTGSISSSAFGGLNKIGQDEASPYSFVAGLSNEVNGLDGCNAVFGENHYIEACSHVGVFGEENELYAVCSYSFVVGLNNYLDASGYCVVGGDGNAVYDSGRVAVFGRSNTVGSIYPSHYSLIVGHGNIVDGAAGFGAHGYNVALGRSNTIDEADYAFVCGSQNKITTNYSSIIGGKNAQTNWHGQVAHATSSFDPANYLGEAQNTIDLALTGITQSSPAAWTEIFLDGVGGNKRVLLAYDTTYVFHVLIVARKKLIALGSPMTKTWSMSLTVQRESNVFGSGAVNIVGMDVATVHSTSNDDEYLWDVRAMAGTDHIKFEVYGSDDGAAAVAWQVSMRAAEVCPAHITGA